MSGDCSDDADEKDGREDAILALLYDWTVKNVFTPNDLGTMVAYVLLFLISWYVILSALRFVMRLMWPVIVVVSAVLLFRFLRTFEPADLADMFLYAIGLVADLSCLLATYALYSLVGSSQAEQFQLQQSKLKRDAGLHFGTSAAHSSHSAHSSSSSPSSHYHGPSHKYLPPASSVLGYEGGSYSSLHGNGLASSHGLDFGSLDADNYHLGHQPQPSPHHHQSHHHVSAHRPLYHHAPKVETYIVQTSSHGHGGGHGLGHGIGTGHSVSLGHGHAAHGGYKLSPHIGSSSIGGGGGGSTLSLLGGHKLHTGFMLPSSLHRYGGEYSYSGHQSKPSFASSSHTSSHGPSLSLSHGHGSNLGLNHVALDLSGHSHGSSSSSGSGYHYSPTLSHELESHHVHGGAQESSGYSYDVPSLAFGAGSKPISSYGVPLLSGYDHEPKEESTAGVSSHGQHEHEQAPAYALGQKGLGHFTYTASTPHALHTDIIGLTSHHQSDEGAHSVSMHEHNDHTVELSKAPFKPSAFLGAKHESSSDGHDSQSYDFDAANTQYVQAPISTGYDYQPSTVLYGAPTHSGDSATPIFEPEATYLPPAAAAVPQLSYGQPAGSSHGYHH
ncbi:hornerin [Scaptodrosophila lebanonensis]|uniref:Hornerin n=1 Tax=Drosophila lebanonensis TaxID=7225 RepID=A0A6J2U2U7_DROLE|nr:hornerin [Scaptodrosophila lebanonensis]